MSESMNEKYFQYKWLSLALHVAYIARGTRNGNIAMNSCPDMYYSLTALALCWKLRRCLTRLNIMLSEDLAGNAMLRGFFW